MHLDHHHFRQRTQFINKCSQFPQNSKRISGKQISSKKFQILQSGGENRTMVFAPTAQRTFIHNSQHKNSKIYRPQNLTTLRTRQNGSVLINSYYELIDDEADLRGAKLKSHAIRQVRAVYGNMDKEGSRESHSKPRIWWSIKTQSQNSKIRVKTTCRRWHHCRR